MDFPNGYTQMRLIGMAERILGIDLDAHCYYGAFNCKS